MEYWLPASLRWVFADSSWWMFCFVLTMSKLDQISRLISSPCSDQYASCKLFAFLQVQCSWYTVMLLMFSSLRIFSPYTSLQSILCARLYLGLKDWSRRSLENTTTLSYFMAEAVTAVSDDDFPLAECYELSCLWFPGGRYYFVISRLYIYFRQLTCNYRWWGLLARDRAESERTCKSLSSLCYCVVIVCTCTCITYSSESSWNGQDRSG